MPFGEAAMRGVAAVAGVLGAAVLSLGCGRTGEPPRNAGALWQGPTTEAVAELAAGVCVGAWCWENPLPTGEDLRAVDGAGPNDVWFAGTDGALVHFDGSRFQCAHPRWTRGRDFSAVTVKGAEVVAVGPDAPLVRRDGDRWVEELAPEGLEALAQVGDELWAVGRDGARVRRAGEWVRVFAPGGLHGVGGTGPSDLWLVGDHGLVLHSDRTGLRRVAIGQDATLRAVRAFGEDDVLVAGDAGVVVRVTRGNVVGLRGPQAVGGMDAWEDLYSLYWSDPAQVWMGGISASAGSHTKTWAPMAMRLESSGPDVRPTMEGPGVSGHPSAPARLWGTGDDDVWLAALPLLRFDGENWLRMTRGPGLTVGPIFGGGGEAFAIGYGGGAGHVLRRIGERWADTGLEARAGWSGPDGDTWLIRDDTLEHLGSPAVRLPEELTAVWGTGTGIVYVAGGAGRLWRVADGVVTELATGTTDTIQAIGGRGEADVWVALSGFNGVPAVPLKKVEGDALVDAPAQLGQVVAFHAAGDALFARTQNGLFRFEGRLWRAMDLPFATPVVRSVAALGASDVWVTAGSAPAQPLVLWRWDGAGWTEEPMPSALQSISSVGGTLYATGTNGMVLRRR